jgi:hypothetical protein
VTGEAVEISIRSKATPAGEGQYVIVNDDEFAYIAVLKPEPQAANTHLTGLSNSRLGKMLQITMLLRAAINNRHERVTPLNSSQ